MNKIRGLVWDDEAYNYDYMSNLKIRLDRHGIEISLYDDRKLFTDALSFDEWDFVITDLFHKELNHSNERPGVEIARYVADIKKSKPWYPIFILTQHPEKLTREDFKLPANVIFRYKDEVDWMAYYIKEELVQRGVFVDRKAVFLIHHVEKATHSEYAEKIKERLRLRKLESVQIKSANLRTEITAGLLQKMNLCGAIIAVCTPDDEWKDGTFHPRENVMLEIGMALGLSRGFDRLIILQKIGEQKKDFAKLPSDLGGVLTIQFKESISDVFEELESKLQEIGIDMSGKIE